MATKAFRQLHAVACIYRVWNWEIYVRLFLFYNIIIIMWVSECVLNTSSWDERRNVDGCTHKNWNWNKRMNERKKKKKKRKEVCFGNLFSVTDKKDLLRTKRYKHWTKCIRRRKLGMGRENRIIRNENGEKYCVRHCASHQIGIPDWVCHWIVSAFFYLLRSVLHSRFGCTEKRFAYQVIITRMIFKVWMLGVWRYCGDERKKNWNAIEIIYCWLFCHLNFFLDSLCRRRWHASRTNNKRMDRIQRSQRKQGCVSNALIFEQKHRRWRKERDLKSGTFQFNEWK